MKSIFLAITLLWISRIAAGQPIPESTYPVSGTYTRLANSGYKFYVMDVAQNQCRIYNTDHTLWKTINLVIPANNFLYDIGYVSENLFTADNSLCLAYVYYNYNTTGQYYTYTAKVIREDGTVLINVPGGAYMYVHSLPNGNAKLLVYSFNYSVSPYTVQTHINDIPGNLSGMQGDTNCDGMVNLLDVVNAVNYIMGQNPVPFCLVNADINADGQINIMDLVNIVNIIMGSDNLVKPIKAQPDSGQKNNNQ